MAKVTILTKDNRGVIETPQTTQLPDIVVRNKHARLLDQALQELLCMEIVNQFYGIRIKNTFPNLDWEEVERILDEDQPNNLDELESTVIKEMLSKLDDSTLTLIVHGDGSDTEAFKLGALIGPQLQANCDKICDETYIKALRIKFTPQTTV